MRREKIPLRIVRQIERHGRIVDQRRLVDIDIQSAFITEQQGSLHRIVAYECFRGDLAPGHGHRVGKCRERRDLITELVGVVVARNPVGAAILRHAELAALFTELKIAQVRLLGKLVAKSQTVVVEPEPDTQQAGAAARALRQFDEQFVVAIADVLLLAQHRLPCLVEGGGSGALYHESVEQAGLFPEVESKAAVCEDCTLPGVGQGVDRRAVAKFETQLERGVRRDKLSGTCCP